MSLNSPRGGIAAVVILSIGFTASRFVGGLSDRAAALVLSAAILPAIIAATHQAVRTRNRARALVAGATLMSAASAGLVSVSGFESGGAGLQIALGGAVAAMGLLTWGLVLEAVPLMPTVNRNRAVLDTLVAAVLIAATTWNTVLISGAHPDGIVQQTLAVALLVLLFIPTAFAAAGSVNDPTDRRLRRLAYGCALLTVTGIAGLVGPVIGRSSMAFEILALPMLALLARALGTDSDGARPDIDVTDRLRRRVRITTGLNVMFVVGFVGAMWLATEHELMGVMTTAVLVLVTAVQRSAASENLGLTGQLADQLHDLAASEERFRELAATDELTGLMNRRAFVAKLGAALERGPRCSVLFLDLDRFKEVNDSLGHDAGDDLLIKLAERLSEAVGDVATIARFGGDEFALLMHDTPSERAGVACGERILSVFTDPVIVEGAQTFAAASIGVACSGPTSTTSSMLSDADAAMYSAKSQGRNRVVVFSQKLRNRAANRHRVANELHLAIERGELRVHYQPIVRLDDESVSGFEALVRWQHPTRGLLAPDQFLDVAEDTGLIVPLGAIVLDAACAQLGEWTRSGIVDADSTMAVNLAPRQLGDPTVIGVVADALVKAGLDGARLRIELTESALMSEAPEVDAIVAALSDLGVRFSVDDFGTGYASLTYLKRFPIDVLKVDRSFVDGLPDDPDDLVIVNAVVGLAAGMGFTCVAEGIEDFTQADYLRSIGCSHGQGYLFARPMAPDDVTAWVSSRVGTGLPARRGGSEPVG